MDGTGIELGPLKPSPYSSTTDPSMVSTITTFEHDGKGYVVISRVNHVTTLYERDQRGNCQFHTLRCLPSLTKSNSDYIVSLRVVGDYLVSCSNRGLLSIQDLSVLNNSETKILNRQFFAMLNEPVDFCINLDDDPFRVLIGGYGQSAQIYDLSELYYKVNNPDVAHPLMNIIQERMIRVEPVWQGYSTVYRDEDTDFPWIKDAVVIPEADRISKLDVAVWAVSNFGQLILHHPHFTSVAIDTFQISNYSLRKIFKIDDFHLLLLDSFNLVAVMSIKEEKVIKSFNIPTIGSISAIQFIQNPQAPSTFLLLIGSIDKHLRVFRFDFRKLSLKLLAIRDVDSIMPSIALLDS